MEEKGEVFMEPGHDEIDEELVAKNLDEISDIDNGDVPKERSAIEIDENDFEQVAKM